MFERCLRKAATTDKVEHMFDHDEANRQDAEDPGSSVRGACVGSLVEVEAFERGVAEVCGVVNAAHGVLVAMVAEALAAGWWNGWGIHSPEHWLSWQTGMAPVRAKGVVRLAARRADLPVTIAALDAGELALDAAVEVARSVPSAYEADACQLAKVSMVRQLQRVLRRYGYDHDEQGAAAGAEGGRRRSAPRSGCARSGCWPRRVGRRRTRGRRPVRFRGDVPDGGGRERSDGGSRARGRGSLAVGRRRQVGRG